MARVRCLIASKVRDRVDVYTVEAAAFAAAQDKYDSSAEIARWVKRNGDLIYTTPYAWAHGVGGEG